MGAIREIGVGLGALGNGFRTVLRRPRLLMLGALPALVTTVLYVGGLVTLIVNIDGITGWLTSFAAGWPEGLRTTFQVAIGFALVGGSLWLAVITFVAVTLAIGGPFYDTLAERLEDELGGVPHEVHTPIWRSILRGIRDALLLVALGILIAVLVLLAGLLPVVGPFTAFVIGALLGGWMITLELSGVAAERRGYRLLARNRLLRQNILRTYAFGIPTYLLCLIPVLSIVTMPAAVAGATLLVRHATAAPPDPPPTDPPPTDPAPTDPDLADPDATNSPPATP